MPRRPEPEGRRNNVCTKLSDSEFAAVEKARGIVNLSEWARLTLLAAAERQRPPARKPRPEPRIVTAAELADDDARMARATRPSHSPNCKCMTCKPLKEGK